MKKKNFKYLEEFNRWCNGMFIFDSRYDFNLRKYYVLVNIDTNVVLYGGIVKNWVIKENGETTEHVLKKLYGKDLVCNEKIYHFPNSFEELCIINDLNGR